MSMTAATALLRRASSHLARGPRPFLPSVSFDWLLIPESSVEAGPLPGFSSPSSMELMAVPKKKAQSTFLSVSLLLLSHLIDYSSDFLSFVASNYDVCKQVSPHKRGLRNGPKALKPVPVIVRCKCVDE
ncbi:hypothetical protein ZIOFF_025677 [Zingiber officinale]|uniref:Uncharacterized protein n=1 Tax=Zingiber officinale TaxID=94328 RepID=A0A8J5HFL7_ZINOF|nr:hypothetical protein ZIOFF_025677 [Zingiber officinale]